MLGTNDVVGRKAAQYISDYGSDVAARLADDIKHAVALQNWEAVQELERVKFRVRRTQLCDQIRERLELSKMRITRI